MWLWDSLSFIHSFRELTLLFTQIKNAKRNISFNVSLFLTDFIKPELLFFITCDCIFPVDIIRPCPPRHQELSLVGRHSKLCYTFVLQQQFFFGLLLLHWLSSFFKFVMF